MTRRYEVLTFTECDGWVNCWSTDCGSREEFASYSEADDAITEFILDCQGAVARGDMEDAPTREEFTIREVGT